MIDLRNQKLQLNYPCAWVYKIIGANEDDLRQAAADLLQSRPCEISLSHTSSSGKYLCMNIEVTVDTEEQRDSIYHALKAHPAVRILL